MPLLKKQTPSMKDELSEKGVGPFLTDSMHTKVLTAGPQSGDPMFLDQKHNQEIDQMLKRGISAHSDGKEIDECSTFTKLSALLKTMRDPDFFGFRYSRSESPSNPKTVEETYTTKKGDCDELSRLYLMLAGRLGIKDLKQFYVNFREKKSGKEEGHSALFYVGGKIIYVDPGFSSTFQFKKRYSSPEKALEDPEFRKKLKEFRSQVTGKKGEWEIDEIAVIKGKQGPQALYYYEKGVYATDQRKWRDVLTEMKKALDLGMKCSPVSFSIGQAYYKIGDYKQSVKYFKISINKKNKAEYYPFLGDAYLRLKDYKNAVHAIKMQLKLQPKNTQLLKTLGIISNNAAEDAMDNKQYELAIDFYKDAKAYCNSFLESGNVSENDKKIMKLVLRSVTQRLKEAEKQVGK